MKSSELKMTVTLPDLSRIIKEPNRVDAKCGHNFDRHLFNKKI